MRIGVIIPTLALPVAACAASGGNNQAAVNAEPANKVEPSSSAAATGGATATNATTRGSADGAGPLSIYVGRYPHDAVNGVSFVEHPLVRSAVTAAVTESEERRRVLRPNSTAGPIASRDGRIVSWACEPHNCGAHNWTILITPDGRSADVCYWNDTMGGGSRWYVGGRPMERRDGDCPQE